MRLMIWKIKERMQRGGCAWGAICLTWYEYRALSLVAIVLASLSLLSALPVCTAAAALPTDMNSLINELFSNMLDGLLQPAEDMLHKLVGEDNLLKDFTDLFGAGTTGYTLVKTLCEVTIMPIGYVTLAVVFLVQTARIAGKFDANGTMPAFKEVIFMFIYFVIFKVLIDNSFDVCVAVFNAVNNVIADIMGMTGNGFNNSGVQYLNGDVIMDAANQVSPFQLFLRVVAVYLCAAASCVVGYFVIFARALQIYVYSAFAPIPLAMLAIEETRSFGTGFIKNYVAVCLAGAIIAIVIGLFPTVLQTAMSIGVLPLLGACLLFIVALIKSGSWARDVLGG